MKKIDYKRELKNLYKASSLKAAMVDVPKMNFLMVNGEGHPNTSSAYQEAVAVLCALAYAIVFIVTLTSFLLKKEWWPILAIIAVVISQILLLIFWKEAWFGTIANFIVLLFAIPAFGAYEFKKKVQKEATEMLQVTQITKQSIITGEDLNDVPPVVQKWMNFSGVVGKPKTHSVRLKQKGQMKTKPNSRWVSFTAKQYFNTDDPCFVWVTQVKANTLMYMDGRDRLENGQGQMLIKLYSLFPVVNERGNEKINSASIQRYLAELCWFPSVALYDYISWEAVGQNAAKATLRTNGKRVSGIFNFDDFGKVISFQTERFYGGDEEAQLQTWLIEMQDYATFEGITIPNKCKVTWKLAEGDFNWLNLEITDLEYNVNQLW